MKFPSILKIPENRRFKLQNRYYDPIREDIQNRTELIKSELERQKRDNPDMSGYQSRIEGAFSQKSYYKEKKSGMLRFTLMVVLFFGSLGYLYFGNVVLYIFIGLLGVIYFLRKREIL
jgi:hypothetical protein